MEAKFLSFYRIFELNDSFIYDARRFDMKMQV